MNATAMTLIGNALCCGGFTLIAAATRSQPISIAASFAACSNALVVVLASILTLSGK